MMEEKDFINTEVTVHLAEYKELSVVQQNAKTTFLRILILYHSGIIAAITWLLNPSNQYINNIRLCFFLFYSLSILNVFLLIGCGYQLYSFYSVARYFQVLRKRLSLLLKSDALGYEVNLGRFLVDEKPSKIGLETWATIFWLALPTFICFLDIVPPCLYKSVFSANIYIDSRLNIVYILSAIYSTGALIYLGRLIFWLNKLFSLNMDKIKNKLYMSKTTRKIKLIFLFFLSVVFAWVFSTIWHESGHAFFGYVTGMRPFDFTPYPHFRNNELYIGYVDFKNFHVSDGLAALQNIGSEIFQVIGFFSCIFIYRRLRKEGIFPFSGKSKFYVVFGEFFLKTYTLFAFLDWPLYAINYTLKLSHFFVFGGTWWDGDIYLFAKFAGIMNYYPIIVIIAVIWIIIAGGLILFVEYRQVWNRLISLFAR